MTALLRHPEKKSLLSIDGGGIRGVLSLQILKRIETIARVRSGNASLVLADAFDYIAGTSTGAIIAAGLAIGMSCDNVERFYLEQAPRMFSPNRNWIKRYTSARYDSGELQQQLQEVFGADTTLGSSRLRTLLMVVMLNASTSSPWPLSSNPRARYNDRALCGAASNLNFPLWQLVRASAAAPLFFSPEAIEIEGRNHLFLDGALTSYNNPAFKLFQMATLPQYRLEWPVGAQRMLLVSVGTGMVSRSLTQLQPDSVGILDALPTALQSLMSSGTAEQDLLCRSFAHVVAGDPVDGEVGDLHGTPAIGGQALFTYARYNADLTPKGLERCGLERWAGTPLAIDALAAVDACRDIGAWVARERVEAVHFDGFWDAV
jgi:hypothetical protein